MGDKLAGQNLQTFRFCRHTANSSSGSLDTIVSARRFISVALKDEKSAAPAATLEGAANDFN
jgi:hypothetical protein